MADVEVVVDLAAVARWQRSPEMRDMLMDSAAPPTRRARAGAPRATGAGAESIHAESVLDGPEWTTRISWDRLHWYMRFHETGTKFLPARPFLVPSVT